MSLGLLINDYSIYSKVVPNAQGFLYRTLLVKNNKPYLSHANEEILDDDFIGSIRCDKENCFVS